MANRTEPNVGDQRTTADLVAAIIELQAAVNALRVDFRAHDHGSTYGATAVRLSASAGTFSGTAETSAIAIVPLPKKGHYE